MIHNQLATASMFQRVSSLLSTDRSSSTWIQCRRPSETSSVRAANFLFRPPLTGNRIQWYDGSTLPDFLNVIRPSESSSDSQTTHDICFFHSVSLSEKVFLGLLVSAWCCHDMTQPLVRLVHTVFSLWWHCAVQISLSQPETSSTFLN